MNLPETAKLQEIYGETEVSGARFKDLADHFEKIYKQDKAEYFTSAGRTEIIGNHTDHNGGKVIAGSINLDTIGAAYPNDTQVIHITSEGYRDEIVVDLTKLSKNNYKKGTVALVAGMMEGAQKNGFKVSGFDAYVSTNVIAAAGVSSSASFEMLICTIIDYFFNDSKMSYNDYAKIGQYAENVYFGKPCGLMDQMASSVGNLVHIDFADPADPIVEKIDFDMAKSGYSLCITDTKGSHVDLTADYAAVPAEMCAVAEMLGKPVLNELSEQDIIDHMADIRTKLGDRYLLRALHYFEEVKRVEIQVASLTKGDMPAFLAAVKASGDSSFKYLQNVYTNKDIQAQNVSVALAVSDITLGSHGVSRVHGGGFAGTIQAFVENDTVETYRQAMDHVFGGGSCHVLKIRKYGGMQVL